MRHAEISQERRRRGREMRREERKEESRAREITGRLAKINKSKTPKHRRKCQFHRLILEEGHLVRWIKIQRAEERGLSLKVERRRRTEGLEGLKHRRRGGLVWGDRWNSPRSRGVWC